MRHVGNRDDQTIALACLFRIHRVVKIFRRFTINRDQRHVAQIDATLAISGSDHIAVGGGFLKRCIGKDVRQIVFANRDFELDIARIFVAYYFDDFASCLVIRRRLRRDFRDYDLIKRCR